MCLLLTINIYLCIEHDRDFVKTDPPPVASSSETSCTSGTPANISIPKSNVEEPNLSPEIGTPNVTVSTKSQTDEEVEVERNSLVSTPTVAGQSNFNPAVKCDVYTSEDTGNTHTINSKVTPEFTIQNSGTEDAGETSECGKLNLALWYNGGNLWIHVDSATDLQVKKGKLYVKSYLLPNTTSSKQKTISVNCRKCTKIDATLTVSLLALLFCGVGR